MTEICFYYVAPSVASGVVDDLRRLYPAAEAHLGHEQQVVHLPDALWARPLVPELAIGSGGRVTACRPAGRHDCTVEAAQLDGGSA
jgi:hypothetical protein